MKAFTLVHPSYGVTEIVRKALAVEDQESESDVGFVINNSALRQIIKDAYEAGSSTQTSTSFEELMSGINHDIPGMCVLNKTHLDEVTAAKADLPKMCVVTTVVTFENYIFELMERVFDQAYGHVRSVRDFLETQNITENTEKHDRLRENDSTSNSPNLFQSWLADSNNITEQLRREFESCATKSQCANEFEFKDKTEYTTGELYEILRKHPDELGHIVQVVMSDYKKHCLEALEIGISVNSIAQVVERMLEQNVGSSGLWSQTFKRVLNELAQNSEEYYGMIMQVTFDFFDNPKETRRLELTNENILNTIGLPDNDHVDMCVHFRTANRSPLYCYQLTKEDKENIRNQYREYDGWSMLIDDHSRYIVKVADQETLDHLIRLFFGIKNLFSQGRSANSRSSFYTLADIPDRLNLIAIKTTHNPDGRKTDVFYNRLLLRDEAEVVAKKCENHLLDIWKIARDEGDKLTLDYSLNFTILKFFKYAANFIGQTVSGCIWKLAQKDEAARFGMDKRDLNKISSRFVE